MMITEEEMRWALTKPKRVVPERPPQQATEVALKVRRADGTVQHFVYRADTVSQLEAQMEAEAAARSQGLNDPELISCEAVDA